MATGFSKEITPVEGCYPMNADPKGHCVIINNRCFKNEDLSVPGLADRLGSDIDANKLEELFKTFLNFYVTRRDDVTHQQLDELLRNYQQMNHADYDALVIIILSHGDQGDVIYTSDCKAIRLSQIAKYFTASNCPTLIRKPKVFIIQACRGPEHNRAIDLPVSFHSSSRSISYDGDYPPYDGSTSVADESDFLYAFATIENHAALRDCQNGSWFIQELVSVIRERAMDIHMLDILTQVNCRVSLHCNGSETQVSQVKSSLTKSLFLTPNSSTPKTSVPKGMSVHPSLMQISEYSQRVLATPSPLSKRYTRHLSETVTYTPPLRRNRREIVGCLYVSGSQQQAQELPSQSGLATSKPNLKFPSICSEDVTALESSSGSRKVPLLLPFDNETMPPVLVQPPTPGGNTPVHELTLESSQKFLKQPDKESQISNDSSNSYQSVQESQVAYKMNDDSSSLQGYCIVINNSTSFYGETQLEDIKKVFGRQLGFHVQIYCNLARKGMQQLLKAVSEVDHSDLHCLIVAVLSNGEKERAIYGADGKVLEVEEALALFSRDLCPSLADKPKLFFIETQLIAMREIVNKHREIPDTCIVSYFGNRSTGRKFFLEITESLRTEFHFHQVMDTLSVSDSASQHVEYTDNLRPLHFSNRNDKGRHGARVALAYELKLALQVLSKLRETVLTELERKREDIFRVCQNARRSRMAGAITSLAGGGLTAIGFGLIPVTLGGSIAISVVGAGVGIAGGAVSIASTVTDSVVSKAKLKGAQAMIEVDRQLTEQVNKLLEKVNVIESIQDPSTNREDAIALLFQGRQAVRLGTVAVKSGTGGAQIARTAVQGTAFGVRVAGSAARGVAVVGGVATALTLPLDIYELVSNSYRLYKRSETEATKWFNKQLEILCDQKQKVEQMIKMLKPIKETTV